MKSTPDSTHSLPPHIEERFQQLPLCASPRFSLSLQERIQTQLPQSAEDRALDSLFLPDPSLGLPDMPQRVRQRLHATAHPPASRLLHFPWQRFIAPVAAAATLALAFISFQQEAPDYPRQTATPVLASNLQTTTDSEADAELTRIFALAQNLKPSVQVDQLRSSDALSFLVQ